jgi:CRISPR system Cascade subunit CasA
LKEVLKGAKMSVSFNLVDEKWLPCIRADGTPVELGLRDTLIQAHTLRELYGETPLVTAALHRLLLAVLHRVFGPESRRAWQQLWQAGHWDEAALDAYFGRWRHRFDLFDPQRPFYQTPTPPGKPRPANALASEWASGNNATLFDHTLDSLPPALTASHAARLAATLQTFHLAGLAGPGLPNFSDAPWARGAIFLVQGDTLFETLAFNLVRSTTETPIPGQPDDRPAWEQDNPLSPGHRVPLGYLDYLTWQSRQLKLAAEVMDGQIVVRSAWVAQGLGLEPEVIDSDPMKVYRARPKGWLPLRFTEERALWRDSDALFRLHDDPTKGTIRPPRSFLWLADLLDGGLLDPSSIYRYMVFGMANEQAKIHFCRQEHMPLPLALLKRDGPAAQLRNALKDAEDAGKALRGAGWELAGWLVSPADKNKARREDVETAFNQLNLERRYWSRLEVPFRRFVEDLPGDAETARNTWRGVVLKTAREAFSEAAAGIGDPIRGLKAVVKASGLLEWRLKEIKPDNKENETTVG